MSRTGGGRSGLAAGGEIRRPRSIDLGWVWPWDGVLGMATSVMAVDVDR